MIPLVGRPPLRREQALDAARRIERDRDPVDRVGGEGHDAAGPQDLDRGGTTLRVVGNDPRGHAGTPTARAPGAPPPRPLPGIRASARRASAGASTSASIIRATPSSANGGAM